jgi:shikimate dehydrogenase
LAIQPYQLGLVGWPLGHSLSPAIHAAALEAAGLEGHYRLFPCPNGLEGDSQVNHLLNRLRGGELNGLNVTIPFKQTVLGWADELTPFARLVGAVNTLFLREGKLVGDNTDGPGLLKDLTQPLSGAPLIKPPGSGKTVLILGAGGAARSAAAVLASFGMKVFVAARNIRQAKDMVEKEEIAPNRQSKQGLIAPISLDVESLFRLTPALIVNATPLGMFPDVNASPWPSELPFPPGAAVYDMVYNPLETALLRDARASGLTAVNGLGMLVEQAALSFEIWTGAQASRPAMYEAATRLLTIPANPGNPSGKEAR